MEWVIDVPCFLCMLKYFITSCFTGPIVQKQRRNLVEGFDWLGGLYMRNSSIASQVLCLFDDSAIIHWSFSPFQFSEHFNFVDL